MPEGPNPWIVQLLGTTDQGIDTARGCIYHRLWLWYLPLARIHGVFVMMKRAYRLGMGVGRFSRPLRRVRVLGMPDVGLDTMWCTESVWEVTLGAGLLRLLVPGVAVGEFIDRSCVVDRVEVTYWVICAMGELFSEDEGVEFRPWIAEAMECLLWEEFHLRAGMEMHLWGGGSWQFPKCPRLCWFWRLGRLRTFHTTGIVQGVGFGKA